MEPYLESVGATFTVNRAKYLVISIYRPPDACIDDCLSKLEIMLNYISNGRFSRVYITGDVNIDILKGENNKVRHLKNLMHSFNLQCVIAKPTRLDYRTGRASLLDHIWTNDVEHNSLNNILFDDISDHFATLSHFGIDKEPNSRHGTVRNRDFSVANKEHFIEELTRANWQSVYTSQDANEAYNEFYSTFFTIYDKNFPFIERTHKGKRLHPYISPAITRSLKGKKTTT